MSTFLCKTEPGDYSYDDLERDGRTVWDGVANPTANIHTRSIKAGDDILIYHTGGDKAIVGLARAVSDPYPDPERPERTAKGETKYPVFDIEPVKRASTPAALKDIKADERFAEFPLVTMGRLSVMPVPKKLDTALRKMAGL
jgi:predicted RNA-binding protein with PUA-like domain